MKKRKGAYKFINEEFLASLQNVDTRDDTAKLNDLRQSVRRLVGEWEKKSEDLWNNRPENDSRPKSEAISQCADELSALIDGKGDQS